MRDTKGITLISLIITIIILLILVVVAINLSIGNNALFNRTQGAVNKNIEAMAIEEVEIALVNYQIEYNSGKYMEETENYKQKEYIKEKLKDGIKTENFFAKSIDDIVMVYEGDDDGGKHVATGSIDENGNVKWGLYNESIDIEKKERLYIIKDGIEQVDQSPELLNATAEKENDYLKLTLNSYTTSRAGYSLVTKYREYTKIFVDCEASSISAAGNGAIIFVNWGSEGTDVINDNQNFMIYKSFGSGNTLVARSIFKVDKELSEDGTKICIASNSTTSNVTHILRIYNLWLER